MKSEVSSEEGFIGSDKLIIGIVLGVLTFWLFAQSLVNVAPSIEKSIGIPLESLNFAISLTALFSGCFIVIAGGLADKFGRIKFTYIGYTLSIIGSLCLIFANNIILFSLGRVIQGLSAACIMPATLALVKTFYHDQARQRALSFWSIGSWGGSGLCSLVGGAIATYLGWQAIFVFSIIFAIVGMLLIRGTPESKMEQSAAQTKFDYSGLLFFVIALLSLNLVITKGRSLGWSSNIILVLAVIFIIAITIFLIIESRKRAIAFIDFSLFNNKYYRGATLSNFLLNAAAGTLLVANTYIQTGRGLTPFQTGLLSIGYLVTVLAMIRVGEKVLQKIGAKKPMLLGTLMTAIGIALMSLTFLTDTPYIIAVLCGFILFGLGLGFYATPSIDTAISHSPVDKIGMASGVYKMASSLGGAFGIAIASSVYAALLALGFANAMAATMGLLVNVVFCLLSTLTIIFILPNDAGK